VKKGKEELTKLKKPKKLTTRFQDSNLRENNQNDLPIFYIS
jgi:hypothetical protein